MIKENMMFIGYRDFYKKHHIIKDNYSKLNRNDKVIYKYYIYSRRQLRECTCDLIWRFLNDTDEYDEFTITPEMLKEECFKYRM